MQTHMRLPQRGVGRCGCGAGACHEAGAARHAGANTTANATDTRAARVGHMAATDAGANTLVERAAIARADPAGLGARAHAHSVATRRRCRQR